jgi:hypothetical protein
MTDETGGSLEAILTVQQFGLTHLLCRGRKAIMAMLVACIKWGAIWAMICAMLLCLRGGWDELFQRWDAVLYGLSMGVVCRVAFEMAWKEVVIDAVGVRVVYSSGHITRHAKKHLERLTIAVTGEGRAMITLDWVDCKQRPLVICGRARNLQEAIEKLKVHYDILSIAGQKTGAVKRGR